MPNSNWRCNGGKRFKAHKFVLGCGSDFFGSIVKENIQNHPIIYLRGVNENFLELILKFLYFGEVYVPQAKVGQFINVATDLKIKGLTEKTNLNKDSKK